MATCAAKAQAFIEHARASVAALPSTPAQQGLLDLSDYILAS